MRARNLASAAVLCVLVVGLTGCNKPKESVVHSSVVEDLEGQGLSREQATQVAECAVPKLYEQLSATSLEAIVDDGIEDAMIDEEDAENGRAIFDECLAEVMQR